jgi:hypothetical protein
MPDTCEARVMTCLADGCSYNCREECCAPIIAVGGEHAACDTFTTGAVEEAQGMPGVEACDVLNCHFNASSTCSASGVTMMIDGTHADCATFRQ